jgi:myo-inositol catabolism protein IolC
MQLQDDSLTLGRFGHASVSLVWDTEDFIRCFLVIGPKAKSTLRFSFQEEDIKMLVEALQEVSEDL